LGRQVSHSLMGACYVHLTLRRRLNAPSAASMDGDVVLRSSLVRGADRAPRPGLSPAASGAAMNSRRTGRLSWQTM
jgi:hypothetical protein